MNTVDLIDKILARGQKLRSAMVQAILNNDPFYCDVVYSPFNNSEAQLNNIGYDTNYKIQAFLRGDALSRDDERLVLETLRSLPVEDLCKVTDNTYVQPKKDCNHPPASKRETNRSTSSLIHDTYQIDIRNYLMFVDSLKVSLKSLTLTEAGDKKVSSAIVSSQTYFVEYHIPELIRTKTAKSNPFRVCSRRYDQAINFKHSSIHDVVNLDKFDLSQLEMKFTTSCRSNKQRNPISLGSARFSFKNFATCRNFTCNQEIPVKFDDLILVGTLRLSVQLGCGRLYFGREFFDAIRDEDSVILSDDSSNLRTNVKTVRTVHIEPKKGNITLKNIKKSPVIERKCVESIQICTEPTPQVLFGYVYISQAQFSVKSPISTFLSCQCFCQEDSSCSRLVIDDLQPIYNFKQQIPLIYNDELLIKLRDNFMVIEFWKKAKTKDVVVGLTKLSLHQYYVAYRNPIIVRYLIEKNYPIIGTDCWEEIYSPIDEESIGQVHVLVACGTQEQINNLENERGFKEQSVKAIHSKIKGPAKKSPKKIAINNDGSVLINKIDVGTQSEIMETAESVNVSLAESQNQTNCELKKTTDLLESLEKALSFDHTPLLSNGAFKAHISIISALHLPSRKKCKSKKSKSRGKHEDILPSTYVTFEINDDMKLTQIIPKTTSPNWSYNCNVGIPTEYLTNGQKRLVFKVWRKSTNTTMLPNFQTDVVIGFATLDLTVLLAGLPNVQGWFNIVDFSGKINGQINIHIDPMENLTKFQSDTANFCQLNCAEQTSIEEATNFGEPGELLGRALKRKFIELDEITQRLRLRLSKVTNDESSCDQSNDELVDEFEQDINTLCVEDDFDTIDFEKEAEKFSVKHRKGPGPGLLQEGKQKIDTLLEKLTLLSEETGNTSRYVSGCSTSQEETDSAEKILEDLDHSSRPNIHSTTSFNQLMDVMCGHLDGTAKTEETNKQTNKLTE